MNTGAYFVKFIYINKIIILYNYQTGYPQLIHVHFSSRRALTTVMTKNLYKSSYKQKKHVHGSYLCESRHIFIEMAF